MLWEKQFELSTITNQLKARRLSFVRNCAHWFLQCIYFISFLFSYLWLTINYQNGTGLFGVSFLHVDIVAVIWSSTLEDFGSNQREELIQGLLTSWLRWVWTPTGCVQYKVSQKMVKGALIRSTIHIRESRPSSNRCVFVGICLPACVLLAFTKTLFYQSALRTENSAALMG